MSLVSISASCFEFSELWKLAEFSSVLEREKIGVELFADGMGFGETGYLKGLFPGIDLGMHCPAKDINLLADEDSRTWRYTISRMESTLASCQGLRCPYMVLHTNVTAQPLTGEPNMLRERGIERIGKIAELGERYGVRIWVENVGTVYRGTLLYTYEDYIDLFRQLPQVDALVDVGHAHINGWDIPQLIKTLGPRLKGLHIHDNFGVRDVHIRMGSGNIAFDGIREAVSRLQTPPNMIVEYLMPSCDNVPAILDDCRALAGWHGEEGGMAI